LLRWNNFSYYKKGGYDMNNFIYHVYTDVRFGKDQINTLPQLIAPLGKKVLLVYGGGSIKKNGIYEKIQELLADCEIYELSGIEPNPKIESVRKGVTICKEHGIEVDKRKVMLDEPIRTLGSRFVEVKIHQKVVTKIRVDVREKQ
jgi:hypothetical protein